MAATTNLYIYTQQTSAWWLQQQIYLLNRSALVAATTNLPLVAATTNLSLVAATTNLPLAAATTNLSLVAATTDLSTQQICPWWLQQQTCPWWLQQQIYLPNRSAPGGSNKSISPTDLRWVTTTTNLTPSTQLIGPWWLQQNIWPHLPNRLAPGGYNKTSDPIYPTDWPLVAMTHQTHLPIGLAPGSSALNLIQSSKWTHPWSAYRMRGEPEVARRGPPPSPPWWNLWPSADHCSAGLQSPHWNQASIIAEIN